MKQFLLTEEPDKDGLVRLRGEDYHYLAHVRRLKPGAAFTALLPPSSPRGGDSAANPAANSAAGSAANLAPDSGRLVTVTVLDMDGQTLTGTIAPALNKTIPQPPIILFQAMPKEPRMDLIVRQAAESGISEVVPFIAEYSIAKQHYRTERWERIIKEARQQSGSAVETRIRRPLTSDQLFAYWTELCSETSLGVVFNPDDPLAQGGFHHYLSKEPLLVVLAVGPEGGFSAGEIDRFLGAGFKSLYMGPALLRTETAALYGAAAVRIILMEKEWWTLKKQKNQ